MNHCCALSTRKHLACNTLPECHHIRLLEAAVLQVVICATPAAAVIQGICIGFMHGAIHRDQGPQVAPNCWMFPVWLRTL